MFFIFSKFEIRLHLNRLELRKFVIAFDEKYEYNDILSSNILLKKCLTLDTSADNITKYNKKK